MSTYINDLNSRMDSSLEAYKKNINSVRAGRASPDLLNQIRVEVYGNFMPLNQLSTVSVQDNSMLLVQVWDRGNIEAVEKSIRLSDLGLNPASDGNTVRVPLPKLSEERRLELVKICGNHSEQGKISIRNIRRDVIDQLKKKQKSKELSEDELHNFSDDIQKTTDEFIAKIDKIFDAKKIEIMAV